jgi:hypothetical protein
MGRRLVADASNVDVVGCLVWFVASFVVTVVAMRTIEHDALALPRSRDLSSDYVVSWLTTYGGALLALSAIAGLLLFGHAKWEIVLTWPWIAGLVVALAAFLSWTPYSDGGSRFCDAPRDGSCSNAWGIGAALLAIVAGVALGGLCIALVSARRLLQHVRRAPDS